MEPRIGISFGPVIIISTISAIATFFQQFQRFLKIQAGAELGQAQVKLEVIVKE